MYVKRKQQPANPKWQIDESRIRDPRFWFVKTKSGREIPISWDAFWHAVHKKWWETRKKRDARGKMPVVSGEELAILEYFARLIWCSGVRGDRFVQAFCSQRTVARATGVSERTVIRAVQRLEEAGIFSVRRRRVGLKNLTNLVSLGPLFFRTIFRGAARRSMMYRSLGAPRSTRTTSAPRTRHGVASTQKARAAAVRSERRAELKNNNLGGDSLTTGERVSTSNSRSEGSVTRPGHEAPPMKPGIYSAPSYGVLRGESLMGCAQCGVRYRVFAVSLDGDVGDVVRVQCGCENVIVDRSGRWFVEWYERRMREKEGR